MDRHDLKARMVTQNFHGHALVPVRRATGYPAAGGS